MQFPHSSKEQNTGGKVLPEQLIFAGLLLPEKGQGGEIPLFIPTEKAAGKRQLLKNFYYSNQLCSHFVKIEIGPNIIIQL